MPTAKTRTGIQPGAENPARESAQQIWLAGLGAFSKAQAEGGKVFEALVKEGLAMQKKTQTAGEKLSEAAGRMTGMSGLASGLGARVATPWDKLENIFEERVAKALSNLGAPSTADFRALAERVEALEKAARKPAAAKSAPKRAPRKKAA